MLVLGPHCSTCMWASLVTGDIESSLDRLGPETCPPHFAGCLLIPVWSAATANVTYSLHSCHVIIVVASLTSLVTQSTESSLDGFCPKSRPLILARTILVPV